MVQEIPPGFYTATPVLIFRDSRKALAYYEKAFGAQKRTIVPGPGGKIMHGILTIGDSPFMFHDEMDKTEKAAESIGASPVSFYLYVTDCDAWIKKAVAAGGKVQMPASDMFWGDRMGSVQDPFGYTWTIATHKRDVGEAEIKSALEKMAAGRG